MKNQILICLLCVILLFFVISIESLTEEEARRNFDSFLKPLHPFQKTQSERIEKEEQQEELEFYKKQLKNRLQQEPWIKDSFIIKIPKDKLNHVLQWVGQREDQFQISPLFDQEMESETEVMYLLKTDASTSNQEISNHLLAEFPFLSTQPIKRLSFEKR